MAAHKQAICVRGHDVAVLGRTASRQCVACIRVKDSQRYRTPAYRAYVYPRNKGARVRNRMLTSIWKHASGCVDCGYRLHPEALDFDHVNDDKRNNVATLANRGVAVNTLFVEMQKCEVVCANCHRLRTMRRRRSAVA